MDIEKQFDEYVVNKVRTAMEKGERWEILSTNSYDAYEWFNLPSEKGGFGKPLTRYTRQCKLGNCLIITSFMIYNDGTPCDEKEIPQVISGNYCGEGLNQECLKGIEKLIQYYEKEEQTLERPERLKRIMDNNA